MKYCLIIIVTLLVACKPNLDASLEASAKSHQKKSVQNIDLENFNKSINGSNSITIDVRTPVEIANGKIDGALEIDYYDKDFKSKIKALNKESDYYLYCKAGTRSSKAAQIMIDNGFENVYNLEGGYDNWIKNEK